MMQRSLALIFTAVYLASCAHYGDLQGETVGTTTAGFGTALVVASQTAGDLIGIGSGMVVGAIAGGIVGAALDDTRRAHVCGDPSNLPIIIDCYDTIRPFQYNSANAFQLVSFCPALIEPPERPCKYCPRHFHDPALL